MDNNQVNNEGGRQVSVVLPCSVDSFGEFISGLLGKPQEIEGGEFGPYAIEHKDIEQIYHLVVQRVNQQNDVHPISFAVRIVHDDGTSIQLNSLADFQSFAEVKPVVSTEVHLIWSYLIQFGKTRPPEAQEINLSFVSSKRSNSVRHQLALFGDSVRSAITGRGYISYRIKYTARTWGADIEGLLRNYIKNTLHTEPFIRKFVRRNSGLIGLFTALIAFAICYYGQSVITQEVFVQQIREITPLLGAKVQAQEKLDAILQIMASGNYGKLSEVSSRVLMVAFILCVVLFVYVEDKADSRKPSFILLTKKAREEYAVQLKKYQNNWWKFWASLVVAFMLGLASNFAYDFYAKATLQKMFLSGQNAQELKSTKQ